jgi:hypothetical protein
MVTCSVFGLVTAEFRERVLAEQIELHRNCVIVPAPGDASDQRDRPGIGTPLRPPLRGLVTRSSV